MLYGDALPDLGAGQRFQIALGAGRSEHRPHLGRQRVVHEVQHRLGGAALVTDVDALGVTTQGVGVQVGLHGVPPAARAGHPLTGGLSVFQIGEGSLDALIH